MSGGGIIIIKSPDLVETPVNVSGPPTFMDKIRALRAMWKVLSSIT